MTKFISSIKPPPAAWRLLQSTSPYIRQHAHNPVEWFPWGSEALAAAGAQNKPIFLSIGYSTCHWCHVMEHESFEDEEVAKIMNENFINIKVDREERPDLDRQYMMYVQAITGSGGWPLNVFLTPTLIPFYGGTYFGPKEEKSCGRPSFKSLLAAIANKWKDDPKVLEQNGVRIIEQLKRAIEIVPISFHHKNENNNDATATHIKLIQKSFSHLKQSFDLKFTGFGTSTKFPMPSTIAMLLRYWIFWKDLDSEEEVKIPEIKIIQQEKEENTIGIENGMKMAQEAREMTFTTLKQMARGGIHDHVAGGFHRYTVDRSWILPHFEKMLYDQAQLIKLYSEAFLVFNRDPEFQSVVVGAINYVKERLWCSEIEAFYSAEDADSFDRSTGKIEEGAFAVWKDEEINDLLRAAEWSEENLKAFKYHYNILPLGNLFCLTNDQHLKRSNVLFENIDIEETEKRPQKEIDNINILRSGRDILLEHRRTVRPYPSRDEKIVTAWNGMMIAALSVVYRVFGNKEHLRMAEGTAKFIKNKIIHESESKRLKLLWRSFFEGKISGIEGFAEDYAWVISGFIELHQSTFNADYLEIAENLQMTLDALYRDETVGGYYDSLAGSDGLFRIKDDYDGVEPSANSLIALNCLRLNILTGKSIYLERFEQVTNLFAKRMDKNPQAMTTLISTIIMNLSKPTLLTLNKSSATSVVLDKVNKHFLPNLLIKIVDDKDETFIGQVCKNEVCQGPTADLESLYKQIGI